MREVAIWNALEQDWDYKFLPNIKPMDIKTGSLLAVDAGYDYTAIVKFVEEAQGEAISETITLTIRTSLLELADVAAEHLGNTTIKGTDKSLMVYSDKALVIISPPGTQRGRNYEEIDEDDTPHSRVKTGVWTIAVVGHRKVNADLFHALRERFKAQRFAQVRWWYNTGHGASFRTIYMPPPTTILRDEFYPDIAEGIQNYIQRYLESDASVLLAAGPPGTGKTTLLRHMIYERSMCAVVAYDESLLQGDQLFHHFLFEHSVDVMIIEDADTILTSRERDGNKLMSRFLSVSDGLIKLPNKKLIFTTNISDFGRVDPALMRAGRCFDVLRTRPLDFDEAVRAATAAGLTPPTVRKTYTLAQLFNPETPNQQERRVGFVA